MKRLLPVVLLAAACGTAAPMDATTTTTPETEPAIKALATPISTDLGVAELEDGVYVGYLQWVANEGMTGDRELQFDLAVWFSGESAHMAADEDDQGPIDGESYYIRNLDPSQLVLSVSDDVKVTSVWYHAGPDTGLEERSITFEQLAEVWENPPEGFEMTSHLRNSPWWIEIVNGKVVVIGEQYLP